MQWFYNFFYCHAEPQLFGFWWWVTLKSFFVYCLPKGRLIHFMKKVWFVPKKCSRVGWVMQGWSGSCRDRVTWGGVGHTGGGVGQDGVGWLMQGLPFGRHAVIRLFRFVVCILSSCLLFFKFHPMFSPFSCWWLLQNAQVKFWQFIKLHLSFIFKKLTGLKKVIDCFLQGLGPVCLKVMQGGAGCAGAQVLQGKDSKKSKWELGSFIPRV